MAFTGVLGTKEAQPGSIVLGLGLASGADLSLTTSVSVSDTVAFDIAQGPNKRLTQAVTVTSVAVAVRDIHKTVTDAISVTSLPLGIPSPFVYVTQTVTEVIYTMTQQPTITQLIVEVVYKKATVESVTDTITVTSTPGTQFRSVRMFVTDSITVGQTLNERDSISHQSVTDTITVTSTTVGRNNTSHQVLTQSITVTPTITRKGDFRGLVTDSITVTSAQPARDNVNHEAISDSIMIGQTIGFYNPIRHVSVTDSITVTSAVVCENTVKHASVTDNITVTDTPFGRNNNVRITVVTSISVSTPQAERDQINHQSTSDSIVVTSQVSGRSNLVHMSVEDIIHIIEFSPNPVFGHVTPIRMSVVDTILVTDGLQGGGSQRAMSVVHNINVTSVAARQQIYFDVEDMINVSQVCWAGNSRREMSIVDTITVSDAIQTFTNPLRMSVTDNIFVSTIRDSRSPRVHETITDEITVFSVANVPIIYRQSVTDTIAVHDVVGPAPDNNHQSITSHLIVTEATRFSPISEAITDSITVTPRITTFDVEVRHNITVSTNLHKNLDADLTDTLTATQTVGRQVTFSTAVIDLLPVNSLLSRAVEWGRSFTDILSIAESQYPKAIDFLNGPIYLPVAVGTLVSNHVVLRSVSTVITLPAPQLNNEVANVASVQIQRSMNAKTLVLKQSSTRQKIKYLFRLDKAKAFELREFVETNISSVLNLETWDGQIWVGYLIDNPFELQNAGRSAPADEYSTVELNFEGTKLSG